MRPAHGSVSAKGIFRISRSFDAIGSMARTPYDLSLLTESILTPEARAKLPENGYRNSFTESWEGLRVGILPWAWGVEGRDHKAKWGTSPVVYNLLQNGSFSAGKNQKEVYEAVAEEIKGNGDFVVIPIGVPEAVHTHDVLKHNKLCLKEVACRLSLQRKLPPNRQIQIASSIKCSKNTVVDLRIRKSGLQEISLNTTNSMQRLLCLHVSQETLERPVD